MKQKKLLLLILAMITMVVNVDAADFFTEEGIQYYYLGGNNVEIGLVTSESKYELFTPADFVIPEKVTHDGVEYTVTRVGDRLLTSWRYLTSITIPKTITYIGHNAFLGCENAVFISEIEEPFEIEESVFLYCYGNPLHVPYGTKAKYQSTLCWSYFTNIIDPAESEEPVTVTANSYTIQYGEALPTFEYTTEGAELKGTPTITCDATQTSSVGKYVIKVEKGSVTNRKVTFVDGTLTITKAPLTIKAGTYTKKQGEDNPYFTLTYEGFKNNETEAVLTKQPTVTCIATKDSPAGDYEVTVSGAEAENYEITYVAGKLTIEADEVVDNPDDSGDVDEEGFFFEEGIRYDKLGNHNVEITLVTEDSKYGATVFTEGDFVIPEKVIHDGVEYTVTRVGERLLTSWGYLTSITIPQTINHIGYNAFCGCSGLIAIYSYASEPCTLGSSADEIPSVFMYVDKENCTLYVPKDCVEKYRETQGWKEFVNIVEMGSTGFSSLYTESKNYNVYDLQGRKVSPYGLRRGIYIINGKKTLVK